jgi:hypothetical protein
MRKIYVFSLLFFTSLIFQHFYIFPAQARWAHYEDAPAEIEFYNSDIVVDKDGISVEIVEKQAKILNEAGRSGFGVERLQFNENHQKIEIIEAKTIVDGKEYIVPKEMIEIKPLASEIKGFDQLFQIFISYPHLGIGSRVYLKYRIIEKKQPLPNYFAIKFYYGIGAYWKKTKLTIKSELPFHILENDPAGRLAIKKGKENKYHTLEIISKKPAYDDLMNEPSSNQVPDRLRTWVSVSTYKDYEDFSKVLAKDYEAVINQDLPPLQETIRKEAEKATNPVDQINAVTSLLSEKIRYMGDWRTIEGKFAPRSLEAVANSGVGDCKDFSASTAAILKSLGYKAQVAVVMRGMAYLPPEKSLPSFLNFNHAIVKITSKDGKVFWIDPTNFTSMADGVYADITDRPVLVLDSKTPSYENIPSIDFKHSKITYQDTIEILDNWAVSTTGSIKLIGEQAQGPTGAGLSHSLQAIEESIIKEVSGEASPSKKKVVLPPLNCRTVKDLEVSYSYEQENALLLTNEGPGILLNFLWSQPFVDTSDDQEGTMFVGLPASLIKKTIIKDVDAEKSKAVAYNFTSPWVEAKRECHVVDQGVEISEEIYILKSFVTAEEAKSKQYKELKGLIKKYCNKFAIIVTKVDKKKINQSPLATGG